LFIVSLSLFLLSIPPLSSSSLFLLSLLLSLPLFLLSLPPLSYSSLFLLSLPPLFFLSLPPLFFLSLTSLFLSSSYKPSLTFASKVRVHSSEALFWCSTLG